MDFLILISGGIASYKVCSLVSYLAKNHNVKVMMSENAMEFVKPLTFEVLSKNKVITDLYNEDNGKIINHIYYPQNYDYIIVAPATFNIIGKVANGIADDLISTTISAATKPVLFVPAMNTEMYNNPILKENIEKLKRHGYEFIEPEKGDLACGAKGIGKYPKNQRITDYLKQKTQVII